MLTMVEKRCALEGLVKIRRECLVFKESIEYVFVQHANKVKGGILSISNNKNCDINFNLSLNLFLFMKENHDSISKIKENNIIPKEFFFKEVSSNEVKKIIKSLNRKKSAINSCIPVSILIDSMDIYLPLLIDIINDSLKRSIFSNELKLAEVIPLFKKVDPFDKGKYRPVSLLSHISKVFERLHNINEYIKPFLSVVLIGLRKNLTTQHS